MIIIDIGNRPTPSSSHRWQLRVLMLKYFFKRVKPIIGLSACMQRSFSTTVFGRWPTAEATHFLHIFSSDPLRPFTLAINAGRGTSVWILIFDIFEYWAESERDPKAEALSRKSMQDSVNWWIGWQRWRRKLQPWSHWSTLTLCHKNIGQGARNQMFCQQSMQDRVL